MLNGQEEGSFPVWPCQGASPETLRADAPAPPGGGKREVARSRYCRGGVHTSRPGAEGPERGRAEPSAAEPARRVRHIPTIPGGPARLPAARPPSHVGAT